MTYILFILIVSGMSFFISESNLGLFIRENSFLREKKAKIPLNFREMAWDLLHCGFCISFHLGYVLAFTFEFYRLDMIFLYTIYGPFFYGLIASITSYILCSLAIILGKLSYNLYR
jgi:hypothetical protein